MPSTFTVRPALWVELGLVHGFMRFILENDYTTGYRPEWHADIDDLDASYLRNARQHLFVAIAHNTGDVIGTAVIRDRRPQKWFPQYDERVCELGRVFVAPSHRRQGVAHRLVDAARDWALTEGGYATVSLHTETTNEKALLLWRSLCLEMPPCEGLDDTLFFELRRPGNAEETAAVTDLAARATPFLSAPPAGGAR